jgi:hypothetical protein
MIATNWRHIRRYHQISWVTSDDIHDTDLGLKQHWPTPAKKATRKVRSLGRRDRMESLDSGRQVGSLDDHLDPRPAGKAAYASAVTAISRR